MLHELRARLAEEQKTVAVDQRKEATENLTPAYVDAAQQNLKDRNYGTAYVYAAAARRVYQRTVE